MEVYGTQGGALAEKRNGIYYFVEPPPWWPDAKGDPVPDDWEMQGPFMWQDNDSDADVAIVADDNDDDTVPYWNDINAGLDSPFHY